MLSDTTDDEATHSVWSVVSAPSQRSVTVELVGAADAEKTAVANEPAGAFKPLVFEGKKWGACPDGCKRYNGKSMLINLEHLADHFRQFH